MKRRFFGVVAGISLLLSLLGGGAALAKKPSQGSTFTPGTCTTTSGHGSNAIQLTDPGNCKSADNPNQGDEEEGINTGHGFVPKPGNG
jgi:hypothetical protein